MVDTLLTLPAKRTIVVAGEMLELGPAGPRLHRECGELMGKHVINVVVGVRGEAASIVEGAKSNGAEAIFVPTPEEAGAWLRENLRTGDAVLLKASRDVRLERALEVLQRGGVNFAAYWPPVAIHPCRCSQFCSRMGGMRGCRIILRQTGPVMPLLEI